MTLLASTMAARTAVYRLLNASGVLLYVGVAIDPEVRIASHAREKPWWNEVHDRRVEWYPDRVTALRAEADAISTEQPIHNVTGASRPPQPRWTRPPAPHDNIRPFRVEDDLWRAYTEIVGDGGRSADLKAYIEWRVDNPTTPLPGRRRGPVKRVRGKGNDSTD